MAVPDLQDAISHLQQNNADAAITALEAKIDELPAHLTAHVLLARAYEAKQRWADALTSWENVRFLMPNSPVAREGKERVLGRLRQDDASPPSSTSPASSPPTDASENAPSATPDDAPADPSPEPDDAASAPAPSDATPTDAEDSANMSTSPPEPEPDTTPDPSSPDATPEETDDSEPAPDPEPTEGQRPTTASEAVSELEQLRRQAEEEARQGGARADLSKGDPSPESEPDTPPTSPETPEEQIREMDEDDDLEHLIDELESARIEPNPDVEEVPTPDLDDNVDDIVSETLARIHEAQDEYRKAAQIYVKLASQEPDQARTYLQKASKMRKRAEAQNEAEDANS